ncbi:zinc finger protein 271-like [Schistocerca piceifrons]|uniref:zinc finger protein 271-like n=1 Tax=Schistocerca piceifrons TaxID=274613 RepID=UPI001F5E8F4E|nr:zinc finger protein 271-like [Schistocerca piceifrons]
MELLDYENIKKTCRLCLKPDGIKLPIFGEVGMQRNVVHKINICFAMVVYETDPLSKLICHRCLYKLEQSYEFRCDVFSAFQQLKKAMNQKRSDPVIDKYLSIVEDEVIVIGGKETCHPDKKHGSESMDNPVQSYGGCITLSGHWPGDQNEQMEIVKHTPFDETHAVDVHDVAPDVKARNSSSEGDNIFRHGENEITCISSELNNQACSDNRIEADKQEVVQNGLVGPQNTLKTLAQPQPDGKSGKRQKHDGLMKTRAAPLAGNLDFQWCNFCQKYLKTKKIFRQHNAIVHNMVRSPTYKCKCKRKFHSLLEMLTHQQTHLKVKISVTEDMLLKCNLCDKKFADNSILKLHLTTHSEKFNKKSSFKSYTDKLDIIKQFKIGQKEKSITNLTTSPPELFVCDHCRQIFETASSLSLHLNSKCCFILCDCVSGENSSKNNRVNQIKEIMQSTVENVSLDNTEMSSKVSYNMDSPLDNTASATSLETSTVHSSTHPSDNTVTEINEKALTDHNNSLCASQVNQCTLCAKVYSSKKLLKKHQKIHIAAEATDLSCTFCNRKFVNRAGLISHLHTHSGDESYHCKYCTKIYSNKQVFLSHKCLNNKVYPFCDVQLSQYAIEYTPQPHRNNEGYVNLLHENDLRKAKQINAPSGSLGQSEETETDYAHCAQFPNRNKNYNRNNNRKRLKKNTSEHSRASNISRNENCMKCPFCHHLVNPESMYRHIYENHPDSNNIT